MHRPRIEDPAIGIMSVQGAIEPTLPATRGKYPFGGVEGDPSGSIHPGGSKDQSLRESQKSGMVHSPGGIGKVRWNGLVSSPSA